MHKLAVILRAVVADPLQLASGALSQSIACALTHHSLHARSNHITYTDCASDVKERYHFPVCLISVYFHNSHRTFFFFFFNDTAPPEISPFPLHDALPIPNAITATAARASSVAGSRALSAASR